MRIVTTILSIFLATASLGGCMALRAAEEGSHAFVVRP